MKQNFDIELLIEAREFILSLNEKARNKIFYVLEKMKIEVNQELFKKLDEEIWEIRIQYSSTQYRLLAFWNKIDGEETLVVATHGFVKKTSKVPKKEIEKAKKIRYLYFN